MKLFGNKKPREVVDYSPNPRAYPGKRIVAGRSYNLADTNRLNESHWAKARDVSINDYIAAQLPTARARSRFEARNNPFVDGVINTYQIAITGFSGPSLQVQSSSKRFNSALEKAWDQWWAMPDLNGELSGADIINLDVAGFLTAGEAIHAIVMQDSEPRLNTIDPRRLSTAYFNAGNRLIGGIQVDANGKPQKYFVEQPNIGTPHVGNPIEYDAEQIIHLFKKKEPEQLRGMPWLASCMQAMADLADYDAQVLDAARAAAMTGLYYHTNEVGVEQKEYTGVWEMERGLVQFVPPGYDVKQISPGQPAAAYTDYQKARLRELGRPINMPLMMILLDSANHSYSSARFDGQVYNLGAQSIRCWLERVLLDRLVRLIAKTESLMGGIPQRPEFTTRWQWPTPPHVDPTKEAEASSERLRNQTSTLRDECAMFGRDYEEVIAQQAKENELRKAAGLPPIWETVGKGQTNATANAQPSTANN